MSRKEKIQRALDELPQTTVGDWWISDNDWALHSDPIGIVKVARDISGLTKEERRANRRVIEASRELAQEVLDLRGEISHRENVEKLQRTQIAALEAQVRELTTDAPKEGAACTLGEIHRAIVSQQGSARFNLKDCTDLNEGMVAGFIAGYDHALLKNRRNIIAWREFCDGFKDLKEFYKNNVGTADQQTQDGIDAAMEAVQDIINGGS